MDEQDDREATAADYKREACGDPCPTCGQLRWGGDCGACVEDEADDR